MSTLSRPFSKKNYIIVFILFFILFSAIVTPGKAKKHMPREHSRTVVLDPGHGGHDKGAQGTDGTLEKTVTLTLARMIAKELEDRYNLVLTRTDDYGLDIYNRTATANQVKADLFISLHTGGSFLHKPGGICIFYYREISAPSLRIKTMPLKPLKYSSTLTIWDHTQNTHQTTSAGLAKLIQDRIDDQMTFMASKIQSAPLLILEGADMPAVLIEIGYITNPAEEKALRDTDFLTHLAKGISNGIIDFFLEKNR